MSVLPRRRLRNASSQVKQNITIIKKARRLSLVLRNMDVRFEESSVFKIGAKVVAYGRYVTFQLAEVTVPRDLFRCILRLIDRLRPRPAPT